MLFDSICKIDASVRRSDAGGGSGGRNRDRTAMPAERSTQRGTIFAVAGQKRLTAMKTTETDRVGIFPVASFRGVQPTGIAICERGRMCVWFPRRHEGVSCSVTEIFGGGFSERALCAGYEKSFEAGTAGRTPLPFTTAASVLPTPAFPRRRGRMAFPVDSIKLPL